MPSLYLSLFLFNFIIFSFAGIISMPDKSKRRIEPPSRRYMQTIREFQRFGDTNTIFVSIGSYRDVECDDTIADMYEKASYPENIYLGIAEQLNLEGESCITDKTKKWLNQTRIIRHPANEAHGCSHSRYLAASLYAGERFFFQIDSHTDFEYAWDVKVIKMIQDCPSGQYCVLTHYPADRATRNVTGPNIPALCGCVFNSAKVVAFKTHWITFDKAKEWVQTAFWGGGFVFSYGRLLLDSPYDPNLPCLVDGDEYLRAVRAWTAGYDLYSPTDNLVFHHYYRHGSPRTWSDYPATWDGYFATGKVKYFCEQDSEPDKEWYGKNLDQYDIDIEWFGMGKRRTLQQYYEFSGINPYNGTCNARGVLCPFVDQSPYKD